MKGLDLDASRDGTRLRLRVKPGAKQDAIVGVHGGALKLAVSAAPERGKANAAVIALLARALDLPSSAITIVRGESSQDKLVAIPLTPEDLERRLSGEPRKKKGSVP